MTPCEFRLPDAPSGRVQSVALVVAEDATILLGVTRSGAIRDAIVLAFEPVLGAATVSLLDRASSSSVQ